MQPTLKSTPASPNPRLEYDEVSSVIVTIVELVLSPSVPTTEKTRVAPQRLIAPASNVK